MLNVRFNRLKRRWCINTKNMAAFREKRSSFVQSVGRFDGVVSAGVRPLPMLSKLKKPRLILELYLGIHTERLLNYDFD
jgi:hypothetical protein